MARHYESVQTSLVSRGLLRTDSGDVDARFNARDLANNFEQIALYDEYINSGGTIIARPTKSRLRRWESPVKVAVTFGDHVPLEIRSKDTSTVRSLTKQINTATRHPVTMTEPSQANYHVLVISEDDRTGIAPTLRRLIPDIDPNYVRFITSMPRSTYCLVLAFSDGDSPIYNKALAIVRSEHPDLLRLSCYHEEMAQGMGLANDSPRARPSVFNDDEEFALLTRHDKLLLRILYDRRLRPGMTPEQARPVVVEIVDELTGGSV